MQLLFSHFNLLWLVDRQKVALQMQSCLESNLGLGIGNRRRAEKCDVMSFLSIRGDFVNTPFVNIPKQFPAVKSKKAQDTSTGQTSRARLIKMHIV